MRTNAAQTVRLLDAVVTGGTDGRREMFRIKAFCSLSPAVGYSPDASGFHSSHDWCHVFSLNVSLLKHCVRTSKTLNVLTKSYCLHHWLQALRAWARLATCICSCRLLTGTEWSECFWQQPPGVCHRLTHVLEGVKNRYEWIFTCEIQTNLVVPMSKKWTAV